jgi:hypothetical protein
MSGPTNRRFVRSAWTLLAFQFVAAAGALALAIWASTRVQALIDQRDLLQARVTQLEAHPAPAEPPPDSGSVTENMAAPVEPVPVAQESAEPPPALPTRVSQIRNGGSGVTVHTVPPPPPVIVQTPPPREPPVIYDPPRQPPVRYVPPREPPVRYIPPREPPVRYPPPRQPPVTYEPPRRPPVIVRPVLPTRPIRTPQQPTPGIVVRPIRPSGVTTARPDRPIIAQPVDPRRIRRPRPTDSDPQPNPPK